MAAEVAALVRPELAGAWIERVGDRSEAFVVGGAMAPAWDGPWARIRGLLFRAVGSLDASVRELEAARASCELLGARPMWLRLSVELAETLEQRNAGGDRERAYALRGTARDGARALGMIGLLAQSERGAAPPTAAPASLAARRFSLLLEGETWALETEGRIHRLRDSRGLAMLDRLIGEPDRDLHVLELAGVGEGVDPGAAGPVLDARAIAAYRARATSLREQIEEAEAYADLGRAERAREELDALAEEIARGVGLSGRARRSGGAAEKARVNVQRRLRDAIERIRALEPDLGVHLDWSVRTGVFCRYRTQ